MVVGPPSTATVLPSDRFSNVLLPFVTAINASLREDCFLQSQKRAIVTPLLKKPGSNADELKNYRPVSNLTLMSKLVLARLVRHLETHGLMSRLQSAYRRHHSTDTALLTIMSDIFAATDRQQVTLLRLLDLSAAFDCFDHHILLRRLRDKFGITGSAHDWIELFLSGRTQQVYYKRSLSAVTLLLYEVHQGSVIGSVLFLLYVAEVLDLIIDADDIYTGSHEHACNTSVNCDAASSQLHNPDP